MGKLINEQFKEDYKLIVLWLFIPLILSLLFSRLANSFEGSFLVMLGAFLSFMALAVGPAVAAILIARNDYERFYGKYAAFYSALPVTTGNITMARVIHYFVMTIIITLIVIIDFFVIMYANGLDIASLDRVLRVISEFINNVGVGFIASTIFYMIAAILTSILMVVFSITAGSTKFSGRSIKFGPIIVYILLSLIIGLIFALVQNSVLDIFSANSTLIDSASVEFTIEMVRNISPMIVIVPTILSIVLSALMYYGTYFFHQKKLSVA